MFTWQKPSPTSAPERTLWSSPATTHQSWVSSWQAPGRSQLGGPTPRPYFAGTFAVQFFLSQVDHRKRRWVRKGMEMKLPQKWSGQLYLPLGEAPRAQQREPHSRKSCQDCLWRKRLRGSGFFVFFFYSPLNETASRKSLSFLSPSLHTDVNLKVMQKLFPSFQSRRTRKSGGEKTLWQPQLTGSSTGTKAPIKKF